MLCNVSFSHFADDFVNTFSWMKMYEFHLRFHWNLFEIRAWRQPGNKPLSEPVMFNILTHICITRPQWVKNKTLSGIESIQGKYTNYKQLIDVESLNYCYNIKSFCLMCRILNLHCFHSEFLSLFEYWCDNLMYQIHFQCIDSWQNAACFVKCEIISFWILFWAVSYQMYLSAVGYEQHMTPLLQLSSWNFIGDFAFLNNIWINESILNIF